MELEFTKSVNEAVTKAKEFSDVGEKIRSLIQEIEHLMYNVDTPNCIPTVKKICMIDLKALLEKFRSDVNHTIQMREALSGSFAELVIDESRVYNIHDEILKYMTLVKKPDRLPSERNSYYHNYAQEEQYSRNEIAKSSYFNNYPQDVSRNDFTNDLAFLQFHKDYKNDPSEKFPVTVADYFEANCPKKFLHFFQSHENRFHYIDLTRISPNTKPQFESVDLNINFNIPAFHKSIVIPNGDIYVVGGCDGEDPNKKMNTTFLYDWGKQSLIPKAKMSVGRSSFGICYMNRYIWVVGGLTNNSTYTRTCEKYDTLTNKWTQIADINHEILAPCVTSFNNKYLFKFGGCGVDDRLEPIVEKYDPSRNVWTVLNVKIDIPASIKPGYFKILSTSACVQINGTDIYVFGGYLEDNTSSNQTFIFRVQEESEYSASYQITKIGVKTLTHPEAFWNNTPIVFNKHIYALQNVQTLEREDGCLDDKRRLITFDSCDWLTIA